MKKNWGSSSKGISIRSFPITSLDPGTLVDQLVLLRGRSADLVQQRLRLSKPLRHLVGQHVSITV